MVIKIIPINKNPKYIVVTKFLLQENEYYYHYHLDKLGYVNKYCDVGCWIIKYKNPS